MSKNRPIFFFKKAWNDFKNYFDVKCKCYSAEMEKEDAKKSHWICWSESDLVTQLTRFYYKRLEESGLNDIEVHINERLSPSNFEDYRFYDSLIEVKNKLNRVPRPDLIIAFENRDEPFILCAEAKCLRYSVEEVSRKERTVLNGIREDIKKLRTLRSYNVCSSIAYILLDDYYFIEEENRARVIKKRLGEYCQKYGIIKMYHTSEAKIPRATRGMK